MVDTSDKVNAQAAVTATDDAVRLSVPSALEDRKRVRRSAAAYAKAEHLVPPLSYEEITEHADALCARGGLDPVYAVYAGVMLSNAVWKSTVATIPFERRVLLLPQCLRSRDECPAKVDALGLLCEECGRCPLGTLQQEAEQLGYVVLIAEGTAVVMRLLESGNVDGVIGVSCLSVLERSFPHMAAEAIPGIAIPLVRDGCEQTGLDMEWLQEMLHLSANGQRLHRIDIDGVKAQVAEWFSESSLRETLGPGGSDAEDIALRWLATAGKRWRPLLAACAFEACQGGGNGNPPQALQKIAVAVECFHKASLVHDDIEDDDDERYGHQTLHVQHGVPVALNVGDLLLGEGYRLIGESGADATTTARMLRAASHGHHTLCLGQGRELSWSRHPTPLSIEDVLAIFRLKTSPAFEVALRMGAILGGADEDLCGVLSDFSRSLGIAYQIRDDLDDVAGETSDIDAVAPRPSILVAIAWQIATPAQRDRLAGLWRCGSDMKARAADRLPETLRKRVEAKARQLLEHHRNEAVRCLSRLRNAHLKALLQRVLSRILRLQG